MPMGGPLDQRLRDTVLRLKDRLSASGRNPNAMTFRYTIGIGKPNAALASISKSIDVNDPAAVAPSEAPADVAAEIAEFESAGFTELAINFPGESAPEVLEQLEWFAAEVMPDAQLGYYRTAAGTELDVVIEQGSRRLGLEIKFSAAPTVGKGFWQALADLQPKSARVERRERSLESISGTGAIDLISADRMSGALMRIYPISAR